jgi:hypothetical protein
MGGQRNGCDATAAIHTVPLHPSAASFFSVLALLAALRSASFFSVLALLAALRSASFFSVLALLAALRSASFFSVLLLRPRP